MKKLSRKKQIIEIAQNMFREKGYAGTSMRDLANAVGIEAASLYNHIKSKEELLLLICVDVAQDFFDALDEIKDVEMPAEEKLALVIEKHVVIVTQNLDGAAVFLHEWLFLQKENFNRLKNIRKRYRQEFQKIVQAGVDDGTFKNINPKLYSLSVLSALNWIYDWYTPDGELKPAELAKQFSYILLEGLKK